MLWGPVPPLLARWLADASESQGVGSAWVSGPRDTAAARGPGSPVSSAQHPARSPTLRGSGRPLCGEGAVWASHLVSGTARHLHGVRDVTAGLRDGGPEPRVHVLVLRSTQCPPEKWVGHHGHLKGGGVRGTGSGGREASTRCRKQRSPRAPVVPAVVGRRGRSWVGSRERSGDPTRPSHLRGPCRPCRLRRGRSLPLDVSPRLDLPRPRAAHVGHFHGEHPGVTRASGWAAVVLLLHRSPIPALLPVCLPVPGSAR